jgi:putative RecB family exonuclease
MSFSENFQQLVGRIGAPKASGARARFSLTSDILSYRECPRQYGYFANDRFVPARATQLFFGTIIHQILDRCHRHYQGVYGYPQGSMPTSSDIERYFDEVENALKSHGVRAANLSVRERALEIITAFNELEGPDLYPRIIDTEFRLESDRIHYVLSGVVDVLVAPDGPSRDPANLEIWDYKGTKYPDVNSKRYKDYEWQMCVYAELFKAKEGTYPRRGILYFLNELDNISNAQSPSRRPIRAKLAIDFTEDKIHQALEQFDQTAADIIECRQSGQWPVPTSSTAPDVKTCDVCDIRWNCPLKQDTYPIRLPFA